MTYAETAANWWAHKVSSPTLDNYDMGEPGQVGGMTMILATMNAMNRKAEPADVETFRTKLVSFIEEEIAKNNELRLSTDYGPDYQLAKLADECHIPTELFPWKTMMWISPDSVKVSCGYGKPAVTIFGVQSE